MEAQNEMTASEKRYYASPCWGDIITASMIT